MSPFASAAPSLTQLGFTPIPLIPASWTQHAGRGKCPGEYRSGWQGMSKWQRFRDTTPSSFELGLWSKAPDANIGVVMGTSVGRDLHVVVLDFDASDADALDTLLRAAPASPMVKRGAKGQSRFYLAPKTLKSKPYDDTSEGFDADGKLIRKRLIDLLTGFDTRQTVVPPSIHPDTLQPYVWLAGPVAATELPVLTEEDIEALEEALQQCGWDPDVQARSSPIQREQRTGPVDDDDIWSETKSAALSNLPAWVPQLDLYGLRPARGGYECVAQWRASSSGQALHDRKRNLSIQSSGIKDFGTNDTYSAIDLVMVAQGLDQSAATAWLRERLGLDDTGVVIELGRSETPAPIACSLSEDDLPAPLRNLPDKPAKPPVSLDLRAVETPDSRFGEIPAHLLRCPGLVGEITDWIVDSARRPNRAFALGAALLVVGTAAGRKVCGPTDSGTHLYVLGLADTGSGKDHALNAIPTIMGAATLERHVGKGEFMSHQAVYRDLMREPLTVCAMDEFGSFLKKVNNRNGAGSEKAITGVLRTAWGKSFATMPSPGWATQGSEPIHSPAFSLFGASTDKDFYTAIDGGDVDNGFLNRFLLISTKERPETRTPLVSRHDVPASISDALIAIYNVANPLVRATMHSNAANEPVLRVGWASAEVEKTFLAFEERMIRRATNEPLIARASEMAIRLATIRALGILGVDRPILTMDDLEWGIEFAMWSTERLIADVAEHMAENPLQAETKRIHRLIRSRHSIKHRDLLRSLGGRLKSRDLTDILKGLEDAELIKTEKVFPPSGGTPTIWYSTTEDDQ
jgi:hypothetical protein